MSLTIRSGFWRCLGTIGLILALGMTGFMLLNYFSLVRIMRSLAPDINYGLIAQGLGLAFWSPTGAIAGAGLLLWLAGRLARKSGKHNNHHTTHPEDAGRQT